MFAQRDESGAVYTRVRSAFPQRGAWDETMPVEAARRDGPIALGALGESLYLVVKAPRANSMNMVSYNSAPLNAVTVKPNKYGGPQDNTTVDAWSPSAFPVAHFSGSPNATGQRQPLVRPYETSGQTAIATLDGVMHLAHPGTRNALLLTETFSISGLMTPAKPISYKNSATDVNNGFGTLAEAGWSKQLPLFDARCEPYGGADDGARGQPDPVGLPRGGRSACATAHRTVRTQRQLNRLRSQLDAKQERARMTTLAVEPSAGIKRQSRTAADLATDCDLLRARMGGWTEFFVTMFPAHPAQHERRPVETAEAHE